MAAQDEYVMGTYSISHWLIILQILMFLPFFWVLKKMGRSPAWGILGLIPLVNIVMIWVAAFWRWPALDAMTEDPGVFD